MKSIVKNMIFTISILIICILVTACGFDSTDYTPTATLFTQEHPVDLSAFQGSPGIKATIHIEKESTKDTFYIHTLLTNTSNKDIEKCVLYIAPEYVGDDGINSYNCSTVTMQDIPPNWTERGYAFDGNKYADIKDCNAFVAYVLYADGTEWGKRTIDHRSVIERNAKDNLIVCLYQDGVPYDAVEKEYQVSYSINMLSNNSVGHEWYFGLESNGIELDDRHKAKIITHKYGGPIITIWALENDKNDDYAQKNIVFKDLSTGESETITEQVVVLEGDGRYTGNKAYIEFTVTVKRIDEPTPVPDNDKSDIQQDDTNGLISNNTNESSNQENINDSVSETKTPSFTGSTCLEINCYGDGMPVSNITTFNWTADICVAGKFTGLTGENNVKIIWTCPDGYVFTDQQYCYKNEDTLQSWQTAENIGSGSASVSILLDTTGETLATYYFTVTGAPTYSNNSSN